MIRTTYNFCAKIIFLSVVICIIAVTASTISILYNYNGSPPLTDACGVVFGAAVKRDNIPSNALNARIMAAASLYKSGVTECLILSGGPSTYGTHEAEVMREQLLVQGVPQSALTLDLEGRTTKATIANLDEDDRYIFISNNFHLARIRLLARRAGIEWYSLSGADYLGDNTHIDGKLFVREVVGNIYYFLHFDKLQLN